MNNVSGVGRVRKGLLVASLVLTVATLLPFWEGLAEELGIGLGKFCFYWIARAIIDSGRINPYVGIV